MNIHTAQRQESLKCVHKLVFRLSENVTTDCATNH